MKTNLSSCCNAEVRKDMNPRGKTYLVCCGCFNPCDLASPEVIEKSNTVYGKNSIAIGEGLIEKEDNTLNIGGVRFKMTDEDREIVGKTLRETFSAQEKELREKIRKEITDKIHNNLGTDQANIGYVICKGHILELINKDK